MIDVTYLSINEFPKTHAATADRAWPPTNDVQESTQNYLWSLPSARPPSLSARRCAVSPGTVK